jgi:hypothetical protein
MDPIKELSDDIYRERVIRARRTPPEEKFLAGAQLFESACRITAAGIRSEFPDASETKVHEILTQRLDLARRRTVRL